MSRRTGRRVAVVVLVGAVLAGSLAAYFLLPRNAEPPPVTQAIIPPTPIAPTPAVVAAAEPAIVHPLDDVPAAAALPAHENSDAALLKALGQVVSKKLMALIVPDELIRRIVATVDNLPRQQLPASLVPIKRAPGALATSGSAETLAIAANNPDRYTAHVRLIEAVDAQQLVAVYRQFYPLFQHAYVQLGYPQGYFNDRLVEAIDDLLAAPDLEPETRLVQPKVLYEFADPELQARSAGQKIMMRIGPLNAQPIKAKLREIRQQVARASAS